MKWYKKGVICSHKDFDLPWYKSNTMVPTPFITSDGTLRILLTFCDQDNVGRIGFVDVDPDDPSKILGHSAKPSLDIGERGAFDDHGVVTASVVRNGDELWLYYSGYQLGVSYPYTIFSGLAISEDDGLTFRRYSRVPILDRTEKEMFSRCAPIVVKEGGLYKMWYLADYKTGWVDNRGKLQPHYITKYLTSDDGIHWGMDEGTHCFTFKGDLEHGLAKPSVWRQGQLYRMIYSIRHLETGYRLGYAESPDGIFFERQDEKVGIDVSPTGWDSEMICFGSVLQKKDKTYLFYCGNHYGLDGFGFAELSNDN